MICRYRLLVLFVCHSVLCDDCVIEDFENGFRDNFTNTHGICVGMSMWDLEQYYTSLNIESPHARSTSFITPQASLSCVSSFKFIITAGGILELNIYMVPAVPVSDEVTVLVFQSVTEGNDRVVGVVSLNVWNPIFVLGWQTLTVNISGTGAFKGYISLIGMAAPTSIVLIDSLRYIAPSFDKDLCLIYKEEVTAPEQPTTTAASTTTATPTTTQKPTTTQEKTTTQNVHCEDCVTVDFEHGFEDNFTNTYGRCIGLPMWSIGEYSSLNMQSPHPDSTRFVTLQSVWTCMTSFIFTITKGGTLEVNAYVTSEDDSDLVWVDIMQYVDGGNDLYVSQGGFYPNQANFVPGWQTLRITIPGSGRFEGYVMFWGLVSSRSRFLMDSFRYVAPSFDKDLCVIYEEEKTTTITDAPTANVTNTELPTITTTTKLPSTTENNTELITSTTTITELPTTTTTTTETPITERPSYEISLMLISILTNLTQLNFEDTL